MLIPGPDMALVTSWVLRRGAKEAWLAVAGIVLSFLFYSLLCLFGVSALLYAEPQLIILLRLIGGLYLIYLAFAALRTRKPSLGSSEAPGIASPFTSGFLSNLLNPKQMIFLLTVLPAFASHDPSFPELLLLLSVLLVVSLLFWMAWIFLFSRLAARFAEAGLWLSRLTALCLALLGVLLIISTLQSLG